MVTRRQRRPARHLGLLRARRERLRPPARERQLQPRARALDAALARPGGASASSTSRSPGPRPRSNGFALAGIDAWRARGRDDEPARAVARAAGRASAGCCSTTRSRSTRSGRLDLELVRRACEQKVEIVDWLAERYEPELLFVVFMAADHVHHLAWPDWEERGRESSVAEVYRILDASLGELLERAGDETNVLVVSDHGGGSLAGRRQPERLARRAGLPRLRATNGSAQRRRRGHRLFELRRRLPKEWRYSVKQRLPWLRERAYRLRGADRRRLGAHARLRLRDLRERRPQRRAAASGTASSSRATSTSACATSCASGCSSCARATASRSSPRCTGARISSTAPELDKIPDLVVEFRDYAWLGKGNLTERTPTDRGRDRDPRASRPALRGRPPPRTGSSSSPARGARRARSWPAPGSPTSRRR